MSKQRFAWLPTKVWYMKDKWYRYMFIWLCWYWDDGKVSDDAPSGFHRLSDDPYEDTRMWSRHKTRTNTNRW